jgi:putative tributyrin esterase
LIRRVGLSNLKWPTALPEKAEVLFMALIDCKFFSETLGMSSSMLVILPEATNRQVGLRGSARSEDSGYPTLFLLHGLSDDETIWLRRTSIERYVAPLGLAVVMPNVHRSFYVNQKHGLRYWDFVSDELVQKAREFFPLSSRREHTFAAGLSMGGLGATLLGLKKPEQYAAVASLSGVCDLAGIVARGIPDYAFAFGSPEGTAGYQPRLLAERLVASREPRPKLFYCCGTEDFLYAENVKFHEELLSLGVEHTYEAGPGAHDWEYWDRMIQVVLSWLPLPNRAG